MIDSWIDGTPCLYCDVPLQKGKDDANYTGVGHPMADGYAHIICDQTDLRDRVIRLRDALYDIDRVVYKARSRLPVREHTKDE